MKTISFERYPNNPIIKRKPDTFYSVHAANPDLLLYKDRYFFYFRGQSQSGHDQIGVATVEKDNFNGIDWHLYEHNPILTVGKRKEDFDSAHILDPAALLMDHKVYLYYSAHQIGWKSSPKPSTTGLAFSDDGYCFKKSACNPVVAGVAPEVVALDKKIYLFVQRFNKDGVFDIYLCESNDGIVFPPAKQKKVFSPSKQPGAFDAYSISTVRIWQEHGWYYMIYGGCDTYFDYPKAIGLARSRDLYTWERYPGNPVLRRGKAGSWDEGAVWFATLYKRNDIYYLWYEGAGTGMELCSAEARRQSKICRQQDYGGYEKSSFSQIGLAMFRGDSLQW